MVFFTSFYPGARGESGLEVEGKTNVYRAWHGMVWVSFILAYRVLVWV
jgi:hypothetical protein